MRKTFILITILITISQGVFAQDLPTDKSENHIQVKGTNIFLIPPDSFQPSDNFKGFQNPGDQTSMIMTMEVPGAYSEVIKGFNAEMLKTNGMDLKSKEAIKVADFDGLLISLEQAANGLIFSKHIILYGNERSTMLINGIFLSDSVELGEKIRASILSTYVDTEIISNPRAALSYTLDEHAGSLKFHSVIGNGMLLNRDLKTPTESEDKATVVTDKSFAKLQVENKKLFCISRLKQYPDDYSVIPDKGINEIEIDGLKGIELFAINNDLENETMYQVVLFEESGGYYLLIGTYETGHETAAQDIKSVILTFKRK